MIRLVTLFVKANANLSTKTRNITMSSGQFHKHHFLYIEENLFNQLTATYHLDNAECQAQFIENYIKLLKEFGGKIRKAITKPCEHTISNESLCELASVTTPSITARLLAGETLEIKDKYSCPTPTLVFAAFIAAAGNAQVVDVKNIDAELLSVYQQCVDYLRPLYQSQLKLSA